MPVTGELIAASSASRSLLRNSCLAAESIVCCDEFVAAAAVSSQISANQKVNPARGRCRVSTSADAGAWPRLCRTRFVASGAATADLACDAGTAGIAVELRTTCRSAFANTAADHPGCRRSQRRADLRALSSDSTRRRRWPAGRCCWICRKCSLYRPAVSGPVGSGVGSARHSGFRGWFSHSLRETLRRTSVAVEQQ